MSDNERIVRALIELSALTVGPEPDSIRIAAYAKRLCIFPADVVVSAVERIGTKAKFFPALSEILVEIEGGTKIAAAEAWQRAMLAASRGNRAATGDAALDATVRLIGGWDVLRLTPTDKLPFVEKRFVDLYPEAAAKIETQAAITGAAQLLRIASAS